MGETDDPTSTTRNQERERELVREHLALVHHAVAEVAHRLPRHVSRDDLRSAAMFGLAQAARAFDERRGVGFARFAQVRIRGALLDELRNRDWASRSVRTRARSMQAAREELTSRLGRAPSPEEIAEELGVEVDDVRRLVGDVHRATLVNYEAILAGPAGEGVLATTAPTPEEELAARERVAYLHDAVVALPERLRHVVVSYFFEERTMHAIAVELGVTESRVSQMRAEALALLREGLDSQLDPERQPATPAVGRVGRRKAAYFSAIASASDYHQRLDARRPSVPQRLASGRDPG